MRYLLVLCLFLSGCAFDRKVSLKCKGDCVMDMGSKAEYVEPEAFK